MMTLTPKTGFLPLILFFLVIAAPPVLASEKQANAAREVVARVNGSPIYLDQIQGQAKEEARKYERTLGNNVPENLGSYIQRKALIPFIESELIYQQARDLEIADLETRIEKRVQSLNERHPGYFERMGEAEARDRARREVFIGAYLQSSELQPKVSEQELRELYERQKESFRRKEAVHVRHIIVLTGESDDNAKALERIQEARRRLVDGEPFAEIAREYSEDNAAQAGGDIGFIRRGFMPEAFEEVAFAIKPGQVSDVIETAHGFHVLEVIERSAEGQIPFEGVRDFLLTYLQEQKRKQIYAELVARLQEKAEIEILIQ